MTRSPSYGDFRNPVSVPPRRLQSTNALSDIQRFLSTPSYHGCGRRRALPNRPSATCPSQRLVIRLPVAIPPPPPTHEAFSKPTLGRSRSTIVLGLHVVYRVRADNRVVVMEGGERYTCTVSISPTHEPTSRLTAQVCRQWTLCVPFLRTSTPPSTRMWRTYCKSLTCGGVAQHAERGGERGSRFENVLCIALNVVLLRKIVTYVATL